MQRFLFIFLFGAIPFGAKAQLHIDTDTLRDADTAKNTVVLLASDSLCSTFHITIPKGVNMHYHAFHSENVVVTEGTGIMKLGKKEFTIKEGDLIVIPKGTKHSVKNTGKKPLKVISVQAPYFDGRDRVLVD